MNINRHRIVGELPPHIQTTACNTVDRAVERKNFSAITQDKQHFRSFGCWRFAVALVCLFGLTLCTNVNAFGWGYATGIQQDAANLSSSPSTEPVPPTVTANENGNPSQVQARPSMNLLNLLLQGGWFMLPLTVLSLMVAALTIERSLALRRHLILPEKLIRRLGQLSDMPGGLDPREAYRICQNVPSVAADVFRSVLVKVGRPHMELENTLHEMAQRKAIEMQQTVSWLTLIAAVAPLVGLLGTVWGITQAFYDTTQLDVGQNRAEALSNGIYIALVTTICGLLIAIPATVLAHFFENRIVTMMNQISNMVLSLLPQLERYEGQLRFTDAPANFESEAIFDRNEPEPSVVPTSSGPSHSLDPLPPPRSDRMVPRGRSR